MCYYGVLLYQEFGTVMTKLVVLALVAFFAVDACSAKGFGTGRKNSMIFDDWDDHHSSFDDCVKSKCAKLCKKTSYISER